MKMENKLFILFNHYFQTSDPVINTGDDDKLTLSLDKSLQQNGIGE